MPYNQLFDTNYYYHPTYIGYGATSYVYKGYFEENGCKIFIAIKQIAMDKISLKIAKYINNEIEILSELNHPSIVKMYDSFVRTTDEGETFTYIVFEWLSNHELDIFIKTEYMRWKDDDILQLFKELMLGIKYLHDKDIIHRDIKPTNIVLIPNNKSKYRNIGLKLIDFGFSVKNISGDLQNTVCGSPMFMAPEIPLGKSYDKKVDIWSLGIVLHQMKYGILPFQNCKTMYDLLRAWENNDYVIGLADGSSDKNNAIYILIKQMLNQNIKQRLSTDEVLQSIHTYFDEKIVFYSLLSETDLATLSEVNSSNVHFTQIFRDHDHSKLSFDLDFGNENFVNKSLTNSTVPRVGSLEDYFIIINEKPEADDTFDMMDDYFYLETFTSNDSIFNRILLIDNFSIDKCVAYIYDAKNIITNKLKKLGYV